MELRIENETSVSDLQRQFNTYYPYLQLEFFTAHISAGKSKTVRVGPNQLMKQLIAFSDPIKLKVCSETTVADLLKGFKEIGLHAQVSRRSGNLWIETTFTDDWTLERQNKEAIPFLFPTSNFLTKNPGI